MTDTSADMANAHAALAAQGPPKMRVLRAVHKGLVELPDDVPAVKWDPTSEARPITVKRAAS